MFVRYGNILHLTDGSKSGRYGSKTPMIQIWRGAFEVSSAIESSPGATTCIKQEPPAPEKEWTPVQVVQGKFSEKYHFNISIGDKELCTINQRAENFSNIQVYASSPWFQSQPGKIRRLRIESYNAVNLVKEKKSEPLVAAVATTCTVLAILVIALLLFMIWRKKKSGDSPFLGLHLRKISTVRKR